MNSTIAEKNEGLSVLKSHFDLSGKIQAKAIDITPEIAKKLLFLSVGNRSLRSQYVALIANNITKNKFYLTNNSIGIDSDFVLRDGHHRLNAIIIANKTVRLLVTIGLSVDGFRYIDTGLSRTASDAIELFKSCEIDFAVTRKHTAIANAMVTLCIGAISDNKINATTAKRDSVFLEKVIFDNKAGFDFVFKNCRTTERVVSKSPILAALVAAYPYVDNKQKLSEFCSQFFYGEPSRITSSCNHPLYLRDWVLTDKFRKNNTGKFTQLEGKVVNEYARFYATQYVLSRYLSDATNFSGRIDPGIIFNKETGLITRKPVIFQPIIDFNAYRQSV